MSINEVLAVFGGICLLLGFSFGLTCLIAGPPPVCFCPWHQPPPPAPVEPEQPAATGADPDWLVKLDAHKQAQLEYLREQGAYRQRIDRRMTYEKAFLAVLPQSYGRWTLLSRSVEDAVKFAQAAVDHIHGPEPVPEPDTVPFPQEAS